MSDREERRHARDSKNAAGDGSPMRRFERFTVNLRATAIQAVHKSIKSAKRGVLGSGETVRITLNAAKVVSHLHGSLAWCITWPSSMNKLRDIVSIFAVDVFSETRMPCMVTGFSYYSRILGVIFAPVVLVAVVVFVRGGLGQKLGEVHLDWQVHDEEGS